MIALFLLAQAAATASIPAPPPLSAEAKRFAACTALVESDPAKAEAEADAWRIGGGGLPARQCLGLAYAAQERYGPAAAAFEQAAQEAEIVRDGRAATMWVQAANAALAGDEPARARGYLDRALALPVLAGMNRGEAHLDRARAREAVGDHQGAREDLDAALKLVPADPLGWLLSATLARRMGDKPRAEKDIAEAERRSPGAPEIKAERDRIAAMRAPFADPSAPDRR